MLAAGGTGEARRQEVIVGERTVLGRAALAALLDSLGAITVGGADGGDGLVRLAAAHPQAIIVTDLALLGAAPVPADRLILLTADAGQASLASDTVQQAAGLVLRSSGPTHLAACLAAVAAGQRWHDPTRPDRHPTLARLTPRERDIVRLVARGARNRTIADSLAITEGTVKMHLHNIYAKLGLECRTQLATDQRLRALQVTD